MELLNLSAISKTITYKLTMDPLEQFDVLTLPGLGAGLTNLTLLLALNVLLMAV
jgi:hypothetical protein